MEDTDIMGMRDSKGEGVAKADVVLIETEKIRPYGGNPKLHDENQVALLARQIEEHGFDQPIVTDGELVIIKGHGRHLAAKKLGLEKVPVIVRSDLTPAQARAARIADNKLAETGWNWELLADELDSLIGDGFDMDLTAFDDAEIKKILKDSEAKPMPGGGEVDEDSLGGATHKCPRCGFTFDD